MKKSATDWDAFYAASKDDFHVFVKMAFKVLYPGTQFEENWHIDAIGHQLELARTGKRPRLIVNIPPRHLKTFIISIAWPAYILAHDPTAEIICVSYSTELADAIALNFRRLVMSDWYQKAFPEVQFVKTAVSDYVTKEGGGRRAISVQGALTGRGGDIIIIDDPIKPQDAYSDLRRNAVNEWFVTTLLSRLNSQTLGVIVLVMQRLHVGDLCGYMEGLGDFHKLSLPAIATKAEIIPIGPNADDVYHRAEGEPLHPARDSAEVWEKKRREVGRRIFSAQYQQTPEAPEGNIFKLKYMQWVDKIPPRHQGHFWISIDTATSTEESADYTAITVGQSMDDGTHYIHHASRGHWDYEIVKAKALQLWKQLPDAQFLIETANVGLTLAKFLRSKGANVGVHEPKKSKETRAYDVLQQFEEKRVFFVRTPKNEEGLKCLECELLMFPYSRYDDQVDSIVQALRMAKNKWEGTVKVTIYADQWEPQHDLNTIMNAPW
ncbi:phage terminase large subunit [Variovorax sp. VNK109]|uniref:phage terminase large subunit n=1 Tax=Variovorax sp. VNK109 TaxID=3400919 RepID=UPI003C064D73